MLIYCLTVTLRYYKKSILLENVHNMFVNIKSYSMKKAIQHQDQKLRSSTYDLNVHCHRKANGAWWMSGDATHCEMKEHRGTQQAAEWENPATGKLSIVSGEGRYACMEQKISKRDEGQETG